MKRQFLLFISMVMYFSCFSQATQPNIIFIVLDDCNDWLGGFNGHPQSFTPNIVSLESKGTTFLSSYCSAPQCGPSRASFLTGKDVAYTQVYDNTTYKCNVFADNFKPSQNNAEYFTIPGYLKDEAGYYTYSIGKIFHCYNHALEYDTETADVCAKELSWNKVFYYEDSVAMLPIWMEANDGIPPFNWGQMDSVYEQLTEDYVSTDSAIAFVNQVAADPSVTCNKPFFLGLGIRKPHFPAIAPEQYFLPYYLHDIYAEPYDIPYNYPEGSTPYNGVIIPEETSPRFAEYAAFPVEGVASKLSGNADYNFTDFPLTLDSYPEIDPDLTTEEREIILEKTQRANMVMGYLANIRFADAQVGRLLDALESNPEIYNNTIIVLIGDHGFSLGEHRHWQKQALWETDVRTPLLIADLRAPVAKMNNRMTSFLDIFPTLCDYAGVDYPTFSDGSDYLDGISLYPAITSSLPVNERPVLSTIKNKAVLQGGCYPQYSVRNARFHLIKYTPNTVYGGTGCDSSSAPVEEELYEIGEKREVDPNEFHNLVSDPDYKPVRDYLAQFIPGGSMYMQTPMKADIKLKGTPPCLFDNDDVIKLQTILYDENGLALPPSAYADYTIAWKNNLTPASSTGKNHTLHMSSIPLSTYILLDRIIFYVSVKDAAGNQVAFDMKYVQVNTGNIPVVTYDAVSDEHGLNVESYILDGTWNTTAWNYGDGYTSTQFIPGPHQYSTTGTKTIKNFVYYGNGCIKQFNKMVIIPDVVLKQTSFDFTIYPNPAVNSISITTPLLLSNAKIIITNQLGQIVFENQAREFSDTYFIELDISDLPNGVYILKLEGDTFNAVRKFEVAGK
ncbi:MAG: sulfatase-like hydrolase/transferase [Chitinophagales bacterium]|nr:sulfatase-like hydrolase/transferase [Chitinophagales bacterium]